MDFMSESKLVANAFPAKKFFVNMLTRDIDLPDAILDLLDNCVDGIIRSNNLSTNEFENPYSGYYAEITMNRDTFQIKDNCGGIPLKIAIDYAFMMGRDKTYDENLPTVGMYGIGMKRALFKLGRNSVVHSITPEHTFEVRIDRKWLESENDWLIPINSLEHNSDTEKGTLICVTDLYPSISDWFDNETFISKFREIVAQHFSYIMAKGFKIIVNEKEIIPAPVKLLLDKKAGIAPYIYSAKIGEVDVLLEVGFSKNIPSEDEIEQELISRSSRDDSGWTVVCNDRVVLYKNTDYLTGWGEAGVPKFHTQFNGINGVVFFNANKPESLPLNTTKRGIEHSSKLYLEVKNHMRTGTKLFTDYTNTWKKDRDQEKEIRKNVIALDSQQLEKAIEPSKWKVISNNDERIERVYKPSLPKPKPTNNYVQVAFRKDNEEIRKVSNYLFGNPNKSAATVGMECFEIILRGIEE